MLKKGAGILLSFLLVFSPLTALAQESPVDSSSSVATSSDPTIPIFFFLHHKGEALLGILGTTPIILDEGYQLWLVGYTPIPDENVPTTPEEIASSRDNGIMGTEDNGDSHD